MVLKSDVRGADYREKAQLALDAAAMCGLAQMRLRHEAAAAVWTDLADFEDRRSASARAAEERLLVLASRATGGSELDAAQP
jgi:hypothetical protein